MNTMILSQAEVKECLPYENVNAMVETVFREWGKRNIVMPSKINLDMSRSGFDSWSNAMPAYLASYNIAGIKWIGGYTSNPSKGLPYIMGLIILTDPETGRTLSIMDGVYISDWRTGASAAIAAKYLANGNVKKIALVGAGAQGRTASACIRQIFPSAQIVVADISRERREAFIVEMNEKFHLDILNVPSVENAVSDSEVVILLTTAKTPFVKNEWLAKGSVTLAMGSYQQTEDSFVLAADKIVVDFWEQAAHRGELKKLVAMGKISAKDIYAELGYIVAGEKPARENPKDRILAIVGGLGAHDVFIAGQTYKKALKKGLGQMVRLN